MSGTQIYAYLEKLFGYKDNIVIYPVDFSLPWYTIYQKYWLRMGVTFVCEILSWSFFATLPLTITYIIQTQSRELAILGIAIIICMPIFIHLYIKGYCKAISGLMQSVTNSAYEFFVIVDPIYHSTRSSGKIISKINRVNSAYENITDTILFNIVPFCIQLIIVTISFLQYDRQLGMIAGISLIGIIALSVIFQIIVSRNVIPQEIAQDDIQSQVQVESLQQVALIRSSFGAPEQLDKIRKTSIRTGEVQATVWMSFISSTFIPRIVFGLSLLIITPLVLESIQNGALDTPTAIALMIMYISSYGNIVFAGKHIERIISNTQKIKDLYKYIQDFGKQSYPV